MLSLFNRQKTCVRLVLDECVSRRLVVESPQGIKFEVKHTIEALGFGASDNEILRYLHRGDYDWFVTSDKALIKDCKRHGINVVRYHRGSLYFESTEIMRIGTHYLFDEGNGVYRCSLGFRLRGLYFDLRQWCYLRTPKRLRKRIFGRRAKSKRRRHKLILKSAGQSTA